MVKPISNNWAKILSRNVESCTRREGSGTGGTGQEIGPEGVGCKALAVLVDPPRSGRIGYVCEIEILGAGGGIGICSTGVGIGEGGAEYTIVVRGASILS